MLDYIFFNDKLNDKFVQFLQDNNIPFSQEQDDSFGTVQGSIIGISEDISEDTLDELQNLYDILQKKQEQILENSDESLITNVAGMEVALKDDKICTLKVDPEIVSKMLTVVSFEELQSFVEDVTQCVQNPISKPACKM